METEDARLAVYSSLATTGRAPSVDELAEQFGVSAENVGHQLRELAEARHVVLDARGAVVMAHPFATIPLGFSVMGRRTLWWGGCAWDSFALPHLLPDEPGVLVATRCPGCGSALSWVVEGQQPPSGGELAHFLVPAAHIWDDVVHTCSHQRLFCGAACIDDWLARTGQSKGYVMDLAQLWRLAQGWYAGRLQRGYVRRDPMSAQEYLYGVGLRGAFWGLPDD